MYKILSIIIFLSLSFTQSILLNVYDAKDLNQLKDANIIIVDNKGNQIGGSTDINGKLLLDNIDIGKYSINITYIGYENYNQHIIIDSKQKYELNCPLLTESILISLSEGEKLHFWIIYQTFSDEMFIGNQSSCEYLHQGKIKKKIIAYKSY